MDIAHGRARRSLCPARVVRHEQAAARGGLEQGNAGSDQRRDAGDAQRPAFALCARGVTDITATPKCDNFSCEPPFRLRGLSYMREWPAERADSLKASEWTAWMVATVS